jgi:hypothetical protein
VIVRDSLRWLVVLALVVAVIGLIAYARGSQHHRGDEVGTLPAPALAAD